MNGDITLHKRFTQLEETKEGEETYLCETSDFEFYEVYGSGLIMYRIADKKLYEVTEIVEGELIEAVQNGEIIKLNPNFVYNYNEILKNSDNN